MGDFPSGHPLGSFLSIRVSGTTSHIRISPYHNIITSTIHHARTAFRYLSNARTDFLPYTVGVSYSVPISTRILPTTPLSVEPPQGSSILRGSYIPIGGYLW